MVKIYSIRFSYYGNFTVTKNRGGKGGRGGRGGGRKTMAGRMAAFDASGNPVAGGDDGKYQHMEKLFNSCHIYHKIHVSILPINNSNGLNQIAIETNFTEFNCFCQPTDIPFKMTTLLPVNMTSWDFLHQSYVCLSREYLLHNVRSMVDIFVNMYLTILNTSAAQILY